MKAKRLLTISAAALLSAVAAPVAAQSEVPVEDRLSRLESMMNSGTLIELLQRIESLQAELQALRGEIEEQTHGVSQLKKRQRELYLDIDRRINKIETSGVQMPAGDESDGSAANTGETGTNDGGGIDVGAVDTPTNGIDPIKEQDAYQSAFNLLKTGQYEEAGAAFEGFIGEYGQGKYADNAQYWLAETFYVRQRFEDAVSQFRVLTASFPNSAKYPHALLKIGYSQAELGRTDEARQTLDELIAKYPQTSAARNAEKRLQTL